MRGDDVRQRRVTARLAITGPGVRGNRGYTSFDKFNWSEIFRMIKLYSLNTAAYVMLLWR